MVSERAGRGARGLDLAGGVAHAEETQRLTRQHEAGDCAGGGIVVNTNWNLYVAAGTGSPSLDVATLLSTGTFLMGCEDEYPAPSGGIAIAPPGCFGDTYCAVDLATDSTPTVSLAVHDEIDLMERGMLSSVYGFPMDWWDTLDDPEDEQNYLVAYVPANLNIGQHPKVLIVGAGREGLQYGVIDWLKSLDRVVDASGDEWAPDITDPLGVGVEACNSYVDVGTGTCGDPICWSTTGLAWEAIDEVEWCPEKALNYPDVSTRMGFPAFGGGSANVLPRVLSRYHTVSGVTPQCTATINEQQWFTDNVLDCDRNGSLTVFGVTQTPCQEALLRMDALVWGKYTHGIDETYAVWNSDRLEFDTACDANLLYEEVWEYLRQRRVLLIPSAFGLEARSQEEPIAGHHRDDGSSWVASDWGKQGDFTHSEGLAVHPREFTVCEAGGQRYLSPTVRSGSWDEDQGLLPCLDYFDPTTGAAQDQPNEAGRPLDFDPSTHPLNAAGVDLKISGDASCWSTASPGMTNLRGQPLPSQTCDLDITLPLSADTENRLFAVTFQALVQLDSGGVPGLSGELILRDVNNDIQRMEVAIRETVPAPTSTGYSNPSSMGAHALYEWVNLSLVVRVPPEDTDGDGVADLSSMVLTLTATNDGTARAWLDDIHVIELDGMLRNVDTATVRYTNELGEEIDSDCFVLTEDADTGWGIPVHWSDVGPPYIRDGDLGWHPVADGGGQITDYLGSIEVLQQTCANLDGGADWVGWDPIDPTIPSDPLFVSYRTWTHAGLWPKLDQTQEHYVYAPNIFDADYWADGFSPASQMQDLATNNGQSSGASDPDKRPRFILTSDLGGEIRGFNRASDSENQVTNGEKLASYYCHLREEVCSAFTPTPNTCLGSIDCSDMFLPLDDPAWAACDCSGARTNQGPDLLIAADMFTTAHNGGYDFYQVPYGGYAGRTGEALSRMPPDTTFLAWWHLDQHRGQYTEVVGQEMAAGIFGELASFGFDSIGAPAWDTDTQRMWGAVAAAGERRPDPGVKGVAHYGWGTDDEGSEYMEQTAWYAWQPEWQLLSVWFLSDDWSNPGGNDTARWSASGMTLGDDGVNRPPVGQAHQVDAGLGEWSATQTIPLDEAQISPTWVPGSVGSWAVWEPSDQLLLRFYTSDAPAQCTIDVEFLVDADHAVTAAASTASITLDSPASRWTEVKAQGARAALPAMEFTTQDLSGLRVDVTATFTDCSGARFDGPALYQGLPYIDFPYLWAEKTIGANWNSTNSNNARSSMCGTLALDECVNQGTFEAR